MKIRYGFIILLLNPLIAWAASFPSYSCPNTYRTIQVGDSADVVVKNCGQPSSSVVNQVPVSNPMTTTQWIYTLGTFTVKGVALFLPSLTITFDQNKNVTSVTRSGLGAVNAGGYCSIANIVSAGDSMTNVLQKCGAPNYSQTAESNQATVKMVTEWTYNYGPYRPQIILDFEQGVLTQISSGNLGH